MSGFAYCYQSQSYLAGDRYWDAPCVKSLKVCDEEGYFWERPEMGIRGFQAVTAWHDEPCRWRPVTVPDWAT